MPSSANGNVWINLESQGLVKLIVNEVETFYFTPDLSYKNDGFTYREQDGGVVITGASGNSADVLKFPDLINGLQVIGIEGGFTVKEAIILPKYVQFVGDNCFKNYSGYLYIPQYLQIFGSGNFSLLSVGKKY